MKRDAETRPVTLGLSLRVIPLCRWAVSRSLSLRVIPLCRWAVSRSLSLRVIPKYEELYREVFRPKMLKEMLNQVQHDITPVTLNWFRGQHDK